VHRHQPALPFGIREVWSAALDSACIRPEEALLELMPGRTSRDGKTSAYCLPARARIDPGPEVPEEIHPLLPRLNCESRAEPEESRPVNAIRVIVWTDRRIEGTAALVRHELEHGLQWREHDYLRLRRLRALVQRVILERVGGMPGAESLYHAVPDEMDANAAAAVFARKHFGAERIYDLLRRGDPDAAAFRSNVGPAPIATLPERLVGFLWIHSDLCEQYVARTSPGTDFATLLGLAWPGASEVWQLLQADSLKLPRES